MSGLRWKVEALIAALAALGMAGIILTLIRNGL